MFSAADPGPAGEFGGCCRSPNMWRSPLNGDFQYGLIAAPMTASTEPPAPIGQLVNTSQRAIYGINRDFRDRSVLRSSRAAEWTTWCSTTRSTLSQHITLTAFATPTPLTLHVPKGCRWW